jgi:ABC-type transport system involved in multi-copper enzyme maturation permease subunit
MSAPYRSTLAAGGDGFAQLLRSEWTKFRTVRAWVITSGVAAVVIVLLAFLGASGSHSGFCSSNGSGPPTCTTGHPPVAIGPDGEPVADEYTFVHRALATDGSVTVRVTSFAGRYMTANSVQASPSGVPQVDTQAGLAPWAKAGVILDQGPDQGTPYAAVMVTGTHGVRMQYDYTHDVAGLPGAVSSSSPRWLRLTRAGDLVTGYDSGDGLHWSELGTADLPGLPAVVQVGMFVTSPVDFSGGGDGNPSVATAAFDDVAIHGDLPASAWSGESLGAASFYPSVPLGPTVWQEARGDSFTVTGSGDISPQTGGGILGASVENAVVVGELAGLIVLIVLCTLFVTSEYRRGLIRTTLTASPRRGRVLVAKAVVVGAVAFVVGVVGTGIALPLATHVLTVNGNYLFPTSLPAQIRVVIGTGLLLAAVSVLALALGTAMRRSSGAVVLGIVLLVLPFILSTTLPVGPSNWLMRVTPAAGFAVQGTEPVSSLVDTSYRVVDGYFPLAPWAGLAVLWAWAAAALGGASWLLRRRDV